MVLHLFIAWQVKCGPAPAWLQAKVPPAKLATVARSVAFRDLEGGNSGRLDFFFCPVEALESVDEQQRAT